MILLYASIKNNLFGFLQIYLNNGILTSYESLKSIHIFMQK